MKLTRVTWSRENKFMVETGEFHELTDEEKKELDSLRLQLEPYGDFVNLGELSPEESDRLFKAKARRGELENRSTRAEIVWDAKAEGEIRSVVLVLRPTANPVYVENLPDEWIDKIFNSVIIQAPSSGPLASKSDSPLPSPPRVLEEQIRECLREIEATPKFKGAETYLDCVDIEEVEGNAEVASHFKITPKKYLEDDWGPINHKLEAVFGQRKVWITDAKNSHWKVWTRS